MTIDEFLIGENGDTHRPLLWLALAMTSVSSLPVIEFGSGPGSTSYLRDYCNDTGRRFLTYDNHKEWSEKWGSTLICDWLDPELYVRASVVLIDQGPADDRRHSAWMFKDKADILVIHDAEPSGEHSYKLSKIYHLFKYRIFLKGPKIWTVALSNTYQLNKYDQTLIGNFKLEL